jgi:hypothetical protein
VGVSALSIQCVCVYVHMLFSYVSGTFRSVCGCVCVSFFFVSVCLSVYVSLFRSLLQGEHEAIALGIAAELRAANPTELEVEQGEQAAKEGKMAKVAKAAKSSEDILAPLSSMGSVSVDGGFRSSPPQQQHHSAMESVDETQSSTFARHCSHDTLLREKRGGGRRSGSNSPVLSSSPRSPLVPRKESPPMYSTRSSKDFVLRKRMSTSENASSASSLEALDALLMSRGPRVETLYVLPVNR